MAPSGKRARSWRGKERVTEPCYSRQRRCKATAISRRAQTYQRPINVSEMVYRFLNSAKHNQGRGEHDAGGRDAGRYHGKPRKYQIHRDSSYDTSPLRESTVSIDGSKYTKSGATSTENMSRVMDAANSSRASASWNSSVSNISVEPITLANTIDNTRSFLKKESLVQVINRYIKAAIQEGKHHAREYIRKALSFGMKSGYLIPADPQGQVIHVSPTLVESRRSDAESRIRRRRIRKGEEEPFVDRRERRKGTPPWANKRKRHREPTPSPVVIPKKRKKRSTSWSSEQRTNVANIVPKKKSADTTRWKATKKTAPPKKKGKVTHVTHVTPSGPSKQQSREDVRTAGKVRNRHKEVAVERRHSRTNRNTRSPSVRRPETKNDGVKERRQFSDEDEDSVKISETEMNDRRTINRRRSGSSREDVPCNNYVAPGNPSKEMDQPMLPAASNEDKASRRQD